MQEMLSFLVQPLMLVQASLAFLQPQRRVVYPLLHEQDMSSLHAFGMGSFVMRQGTSLPASPSSLIHPISSGFGRLGCWMEACFQTRA